MELDSFGHLPLVMWPTLRAACFPSDASLMRTRFSPANYQLEIASGLRMENNSLLFQLLDPIWCIPVSLAQAL